MDIIDFHTHIFPDKIAKQAVDRLAEESGEYRPQTDGTLSGLLASMDRAGISASVVANIATKPAQSRPILDFCRQIKSERIIPLVSLHPANRPEEVDAVLSAAAALGIRGVKLHPMYQGFTIDDRMQYSLYQMIEHYGMFVIFHTGLDVAFPGNLQADIARVRRVAEDFRGLTIVATHVGGWRQWDRAAVLASCPNVYTETSMTMPEMSDDEFIRLVSLFDENRILFGSDSPWTDQKNMLERTQSLRLPDRIKAKMLWQNAQALLRHGKST
ncbi:MAG: amidohydrolase family protein [Nitrospiraceae bacterium]|nr:amidohydrolase family protein [Nitrospiraceae bacterium]